jgi:DNA-binding MarR family transcriptional regulator
MSRFHHSQSSADNRRTALIDRLQFLGQMQSTETAHFQQTAAEKNCLNITDSKTLSVLMQEGAMTAGQLATRLSLTSGAVTSVLDRLEARQLVQRAADPEDRRKVIVEMNFRKLAAIGNPYTSIGQTFAKLYETYSTEQLEFLASFFEAAIALTAAEICKLQSHQ